MDYELEDVLTRRFEEGGRDDDVCEPVECGGERHGAPLARRREYLAEDYPRDGAKAEGVRADEPDQGGEGHVTHRHRTGGRVNFVVNWKGKAQSRI